MDEHPSHLLIFTQTLKHDSLRSVAVLVGDLAILDVLFKLSARFLLQELDLSTKPLEVPVIRIVREFLRRKGLTSGADCEPREEECEGGKTEEGLLGLFAELVHGLTYNRKIDHWVLQELVILVVTMRQHNLLEKLNELKASLITEPVKQPGELLLSEGNE